MGCLVTGVRRLGVVLLKGTDQPEEAIEVALNGVIDVTVGDGDSAGEVDDLEVRGCFKIWKEIGVHGSREADEQFISNLSCE